MGISQNRQERRKALKPRNRGEKAEKGERRRPRVRLSFGTTKTRSIITFFLMSLHTALIIAHLARAVTFMESFLLSSAVGLALIPVWWKHILGGNRTGADGETHSPADGKAKPPPSADSSREAGAGAPEENGSA